MLRMNGLLRFVALTVASLAACAPVEEENPDQQPAPPQNDDGGSMAPPTGDDASLPTDAGTNPQSDGGTPSGAWQPGQKIAPADFWNSGTDGVSRDFAKQFGDYRGRPTSSAWISVHWVDWSWLTYPGLATSLTGEDQMLVWEEWADFEGVLAMSMSMAGPSEVSEAEYDEQMRQCARGEFDDEWRTFAKNARTAGRNGNNTIVSIAQEFNGTWFPWNPARTDMDTWMSCWKHVYTAIHAESDMKVAWVFSASSNTQKGGDWSVDSAYDAYPGDEYVDVLGINRYDFAALGPRTSTNWRDTCWNEQDICHAAQLAREHGKPLAVTEWSIERDEFGYGDNPNFVQMMFGFFADNRDILLLENQFSHYGMGDWYLYPRDATNPMSSDKYAELYRP